MSTAPDITFRSNIDPFPVLTSLTFIQSKLGSGALPVLHGEESNPVLFRIYNNFARNAGIATALNVNLTTYDGAGSGSHTILTAPVSQSWLHVLEHGFGQNSTSIADLYTRYDGIDTPIGGPNIYYAQKGSDGNFGTSRIKANNDANGVGYIEYKGYCSIPDAVVGDIYNFVITCQYEFTT